MHVHASEWGCWTVRLKEIRICDVLEGHRGVLPNLVRPNGVLC